MQNKGKQQPVELVHKPIITGSWHGKDAWKLASKRMLRAAGVSCRRLTSDCKLEIDLTTRE